jgi:hypothetical protein
MNGNHNAADVGRRASSRPDAHRKRGAVASRDARNRRNIAEIDMAE